MDKLMTSKQRLCLLTDHSLLYRSLWAPLLTSWVPPSFHILSTILGGHLSKKKKKILASRFHELSFPALLLVWGEWVVDTRGRIQGSLGLRTQC